MIALTFRGMTKRFNDYTAVSGISLDIEDGSFVSIVGPSGCGKSTLLNVAAGLTAASEGEVLVYGEPLSGINSHASYMFQQDALLPWKTVRENIEFGLVLRGEPKQAAAESAMAWVKRAGLDGFAGSYPYQLSGGMRKRVAMAQSWIVDPRMVLMDEPFSALDVHTRHRMESAVLDLWSGSNKTVLFVTHDLEEAISLSDRVVVLSAGPASRIVGCYDVPLPRPRDLLDLKTEPAFQSLYKLIWTDLREEVLRSYGH